MTRKAKVERCGICKQEPGRFGIRAMCVNADCPLYHVPVYHDDWKVISRAICAAIRAAKGKVLFRGWTMDCAHKLKGCAWVWERKPTDCFRVRDKCKEKLCGNCDGKPYRVEMVRAGT